jgi:hypothetical protein
VSEEPATGEADVEGQPQSPVHANDESAPQPTARQESETEAQAEVRSDVGAEQQDEEQAPGEEEVQTEIADTFEDSRFITSYYHNVANRIS